MTAVNDTRRAHVDAERDQARLHGVGGWPEVEALHATLVHPRFPMHSHEQVAVGLVLDGVTRYRQRGASAAAPPGWVFVIDAEEPHIGLSSESGGYTYRVLYLPRKIVAAAAGAVPASLRLKQAPDPAGALLRPLLELHRIVAVGGPELRRDELMIEVAAAVGRRSGNTVVDEVPAIGQERRAVQVAQDYLNDNIAGRPTLSEVAGVVGLSVSRLSHVFTAQAGMSMHAWLVDRRVARARQLLRDGMAPADVATSTGFADQAHLTRQFRRRVAVTPGAYAAAWR